MKTKMTVLFGAAAALALASAAPVAVHAQDRNSNYDGYCYAQKKKDAKTGTIIGAIAGGLIGSQVSKNERGLGTVGGAVVGGAIGNQVGKSSAKCYNGAYYSYQNGYYTPPAAPDGYQVQYYNSRPDSSYYSQVYTTPPQAYNSSSYYNNGYAQNGYNNNGYNNNDQYRDVQPGSVNSYGYNARTGWRDTRGRWHLGNPSSNSRVQSYGWRDSQGYWHENNNNSSDNRDNRDNGYNSNYDSNDNR